MFLMILLKLYFLGVSDCFEVEVCVVELGHFLL
jgi:hypothetical protein